VSAAARVATCEIHSNAGSAVPPSVVYGGHLILRCVVYNFDIVMRTRFASALGARRTNDVIMRMTS